jgi:hypothetical protein
LNREEREGGEEDGIRSLNHLYFLVFLRGWLTRAASVLLYIK